MDWNEIKTQTDADALMQVFAGFHDSCIREAHLWTGYWVSSDRSMLCHSDLHNSIRFLIQRQSSDLPAIELLFEQLIRLNVVPAPENYDSVIVAATLLVQDGTVFWSPEGDRRLEEPSRDEFTCVFAKKLRWRGVDWLGETLRYGPGI
jgi:hypothetical protein